MTGRKIDGIIHHPTYNIELGALEAARSFVNDGDRKLLIESFKMLKTLKEILVDTIRSKQCNDEEVNKLVAIGVLHFCYNIRFVRSPHVCLNKDLETSVCEVMVGWRVCMYLFER